VQGRVEEVVGMWVEMVDMALEDLRGLKLAFESAKDDHWGVKQRG
jgi:hypothetical protein